MKMCMYYARRAIIKTVTVPVYLSLLITELITILFGNLLRLVAPFLAVIAGLMAGYSFINGLTGEAIPYAIMSVGLVALYFIAPYLRDVLCIAKSKLRDVLRQPIVIRSPIRYTF